MNAQDRSTVESDVLDTVGERPCASWESSAGVSFATVMLMNLSCALSSGPPAIGASMIWAIVVCGSHALRATYVGSLELGPSPDRPPQDVEQLDAFEFRPGIVCDSP